MTTFLLTNPAIKNLWESFAESKEYRENFVAAFVKKSIPSQIRGWMKKQGIATQQELAKRSGITQGVISRAANPNYGDLTLNTIIKIGSGLDCVFVGKYVPFSEFCKMVIEDSFCEDADAMLSFEEEDKKLQQDTPEKKEAEAVDIAAQQSAMRNLSSKGFGAKSSGRIGAQQKEKADAA